MEKTWLESRNAARRTPKEFLSAPFTSVARRLVFPAGLRMAGGKKHGRVEEKISKSRGRPRLRNTPLLSLDAPISQRTKNSLTLPARGGDVAPGGSSFFFLVDDVPEYYNTRATKGGGRATTG